MYLNCGRHFVNPISWCVHEVYKVTFTIITTVTTKELHHKRGQLTITTTTTGSERSLKSSRPSHFLFKLSFIIQIRSLPACLLSCSLPVCSVLVILSSPTSTAMATAAAAASSKRKEVKQRSPSNSHSITLSPRVSPSLSQRSKFSESRYHSIFFFGPLVSKAETQYHDSQRKKRNEASLKPRTMPMNELCWVWLFRPDNARRPSCYSCRVGRWGVCSPSKFSVLEKRKHAESVVKIEKK